MRKKEQRLYDTMKRNLGRAFWLRRMENQVGTGEADVWLGSDNLQTWIELKAPIAPKRETTRLLGTEGLSVDQINWHLKMASFNLPTYILIRDDHDRLFFVEGKWAEYINEMPLVDLTVHSKADCWDGVYNEIMSNVKC